MVEAGPRKKILAKKGGGGKAEGGTGEDQKGLVPVLVKPQGENGQGSEFQGGGGGGGGG